MDTGTSMTAAAVAAGIVVAIFCYFLPATVAVARAKRDAGAIFALNLLLGWTLLGWVAALIWALTHDVPARATDR